MVLEARDRVGGRTLFQEFPAAGRGVELGGTWFDPSQQHDVRIEAEHYGMTFEPTASHMRMLWGTFGEVREDPPVPAEEMPALEAALAMPHGRIVIAGADFATVYPSWITGAINSGHIAAQEAEQRLGVSVASRGTPLPVALAWTSIFRCHLVPADRGPGSYLNAQTFS